MPLRKLLHSELVQDAISSGQKAVLAVKERGMQAAAGAGASKHMLKPEADHLPGYSWWPRQKSIIALLIALHIAALLFWLYNVVQKAAIDPKDQKKRALMEPPRKVGCTYEWSALPQIKLKPFLGKSLAARTTSWTQLAALAPAAEPPVV